MFEVGLCFSKESFPMQQSRVNFLDTWSVK